MHCLVISNNKTLLTLVNATLKAYNFSVDYINYTQKLRNFLHTHFFDIIICDTEGSENAFKKDPELKEKRNKTIQYFLRELQPDSVIIGIIAKGGWRERVEFLKHGGDDALGYPFPLQELLIRMQLLIKRPKVAPNYTLELRDMKIDTFGRTVAVSEKPIVMKNKEYNILEYLARNKDRIITRSELMDHIWDYRKQSGSNTVDVHINRIRRKIGKNKIKTIHGVGYRLEV